MSGDGPEPVELLAALERELYVRLYVRPTAGLAEATNAVARRDHIRALSAANTGTGTWEPGWKIVALEDDGRVRVHKDHLSFWTFPGAVKTRSHLRPGADCRVLVGKEIRQLIPGFYMAVGDGSRRQTRDTADPLVRIYFNLQAHVAVEYIAIATALLNPLRLPFRTKVVSDPGSYNRADAGVLYFERRHYGVIRDRILGIHAAVRAGLRSEVPMLTKQLAPGVGLAEDPSDGLSFGQSRCRIVARGLWGAFCQGSNDVPSRLAAIATAFQEAGLDPARPFLDRGSTDVYPSLEEHIEPTAADERPSAGIAIA